MNAALQCLSNTNGLNEYFVTGNFRRDINRKNPLGSQGEVAKAFANLMVKMWVGDKGRISASVAPRGFKRTISKVAPQFSGSEQHDAHELLATLLDGLHEDLNRSMSDPPQPPITRHTDGLHCAIVIAIVLDKQFREVPDSNGRPDSDVATEYWAVHAARNSSIIVDLFHGQLRSTVACVPCKHTSVRFDPFNFVQLPLPQDTWQNLEVIVVFRDGNRLPVKYVELVSSTIVCLLLLCHRPLIDHHLQHQQI
jgi:ubiquitin carboxyl-terminal hydrolase 6/32